MKKLFVFGAVALAFTVAACGGEGTQNTDGATAVEEVVVEDIVEVDTAETAVADSIEVDSTENVQ